MHSNVSYTSTLQSRYICLLVAILAALALSGASLSAKDPFSEIFTFGDSLSDTGNLYFLSGGTVPPDPPYYQGRFSNGPVWTEHLADILGMEMPPENQFAIAGAQTGYDNFEIPELPGLRDQVDGYIQSVGPQGVDPDALHTMWIGANDVFAWLNSPLPAPLPSLIATGVTNTATAVGQLVANGARHIVIFNLPDLGSIPLAQLNPNPDLGPLLSAISQAYNDQLALALDALSSASGANIVQVDAFAIINLLIASPAEFGLENVTLPARDFCVGPDCDPDTYLFFDFVHPTTVGHGLVAEFAAEAMVDHYSPRKGKGYGPGTVNSLKGLSKR